MAKIDSAYDYYVTTYGNQKASRYDSHKKSDLRKVYNSIVKSNKDSPLYKISNMEEAKRYAIDIKENAKAIQNVVSSLSDRYGDFSDSFQKKVAVSSDEDTVSVEYIGDGSENNQTNQFEIHVNKLATPQVNHGNSLNPNAYSFEPGSYSFDLTTTKAAYEFQYNVVKGESNGDVIDKLARLVNGSNLRIEASIEEERNGNQSLVLTSTQTGLREDEKYLFNIVPEATQSSMKAMSLLGIDQITKPAENSDFLLNGRQESSLANVFTINNAFELTLKTPNQEGNNTRISFKANTDAIADNIQTLVDAYNSILDTALNYAEASEPSQGQRLYRDISSIAESQKDSLSDIGLLKDENNHLYINRDILAEAVTPENEEKTFKTLGQFRDAIGSKAEKISVNPMNYVDKVVVEYKNPGKTFATPYISSIYSGMMMDNQV